MRPLATLATLVALTLFNVGCSRTYISTGDPGVPAPDGSSTRICWAIHGAYGRQFTQRTKKSVEVCIKRGHQQEIQILLLRIYAFVGGDVGAEAQWTSPSQVVFRLRDDTAGGSSNLLTLNFTLDKTTGKFAQQR